MTVTELTLLCDLGKRINARLLCGYRGDVLVDVKLDDGAPAAFLHAFMEFDGDQWVEGYTGRMLSQPRFLLLDDNGEQILTIAEARERAISVPPPSIAKPAAAGAATA